MYQSEEQRTSFMEKERYTFFSPWSLKIESSEHLEPYKNTFDAILKKQFNPPVYILVICS